MSKEKFDLSKRSINEYQIIQKLGSGSFGTTYLVKIVDSDDSNKLYVLKKLRLIPTKLPEIFSEIAILQKIAKYGCKTSLLCFREYFVNPEEQTINIVTDAFSDSMTLANLIRSYQRERKFLDRHDLLVLFMRLAEALAYLHKIGIVHGDIKPENILVNSKFEIQIIDFGLSCTRRCMPSGTLLFAAPEVLKNIGSNRMMPHAELEEADVFSMGIVFYLLANFEFPFSIRGKNPYAYDQLEDQDQDNNSTDSEDLKSLQLPQRMGSPEKDVASPLELQQSSYERFDVIGDNDLSLLMSLNKFYKARGQFIYSFYNFNQTDIDQEINTLIESMLQSTKRKGGRPSARRVVRILKQIVTKFNTLQLRSPIRVPDTPIIPPTSTYL